MAKDVHVVNTLRVIFLCLRKKFGSSGACEPSEGFREGFGSRNSSSVPTAALFRAADNNLGPYCDAASVAALVAYPISDMFSWGLVASGLEFLK